VGQLAISWDRFTVHKKHDIDRDAPYLWVFGIRVDLDALADRRFVITRPATHPNLGQEKFKKGESTPVPPRMDILLDDVTPIAGHTVAGVVVVAWENATTSDKVIQKAYDAAADEIEEFVGRFVDDALAAVAGGGAVSLPSDSDIAALEDAIDARVRQTIKEGWTILQPIADHFIGSDHVVLDLTSSHSERLDLRFRKGSTDYELEGFLKYAP
jgi:hypothetical protein